MGPGMNAPILIQTLLTQPIVIIVLAQIILIVQHSLARVAQVQKRVRHLVENELHHHRRRQDALPQRVELQKVALTQPQELVTLVQEWVRDERIALHHGRERRTLDGRQRVRVIQILDISDGENAHSL